MVLICTRLIRIYLFVQLSYSCLVGITTGRLSDTSHHPHPVIDKTWFLSSAASARYPSPTKSSPGASANKDQGLHSERKVNGEVGRDASGNGKKKYWESPAAAGVIPLGEENHANGRRKYLPPDRVAGTYGPAELVVAAGGFPLSTPRSYSTESWNAYWKNKAVLGRDAAENAPPGGVRGTERDTINNRDVVPLGDTKPVYEFINEQSSAFYTDENEQRDYERLQGPKGNRARPQSTGPNTVTPLPAHRPPSEPHESTISRDTSATASASSFSIPHWLANKGYNSPLHPPPNPVISLILSHYGRYVHGTHQPRVYSYMAVNNIHNNRPFGQYKLSHPDEEHEA